MPEPSEQRILIASDLPERSRRALKRAVSLARQFGSQLSILHVVDDDKPQALIGEECLGAEKTLKDLVVQLGADKLTSGPRVGNSASVAARRSGRSITRLGVCDPTRSGCVGDHHRTEERA